MLVVERSSSSWECGSSSCCCCSGQFGVDKILSKTAVTTKIKMTEGRRIEIIQSIICVTRSLAKLNILFRMYLFSII